MKNLVLAGQGSGVSSSQPLPLALPLPLLLILDVASKPTVGFETTSNHSLCSLRALRVSPW